NGSCPDWVELYNASASPVDITGWVLTDKASRSIRFAFPQHVMQPGEYAIVFADGFLHNDEGDTWHAPFKLSAFGDTLLLFDEHGAVVQSMNIPEMSEDYSYAWVDGKWAVTREYTPLMENTTYNYALLTSTQIVKDSDLIITEVMASNASYRSESGVLSDWIELTNRGGEPIDLGGYALSDKASKPARWRLPSLVLQPGECLVVYASGLDRVMDNGELHASFSLAAEGESVLLYTPSRQVIDAVTWDNLKTDQSYVRQDDGSWAVSTAPTPGRAN
ncbi:MAG: lamin tail domain-containing protein, partial [Clostridia bacterium]|nr:lamin tail domain-containing protein [Clostridia bacterium]